MIYQSFHLSDILQNSPFKLTELIWGSNGDADIKHRLVDTVGEGEGWDELRVELKHMHYHK